MWEEDAAGDNPNDGVWNGIAHFYNLLNGPVEIAALDSTPETDGNLKFPPIIVPPDLSGEVDPVWPGVFPR
jgi:hypothetical protein